MRKVIIHRLILAVMLCGLLFSFGYAQDNKSREITILVTAMPYNDRTRGIAEKLQPSDFAVVENKQSQKIISVKRATEQTPTIAILIQDNLVSRVNNELEEIRDFIRWLPKGSRVLIGYITAGSLQIRQDFTTDLEKATKSLRIITSSSISAPFSPFLQAGDALERFDNQPKGRRMLLMISNGLDDTFGIRWRFPFFSVYLDQAISKAQNRGVAVFTIFAPTEFLGRRATNVGQGSLIRLSEETGGESYASGIEFVTFNPYFREYKESFNNQWLITFRPANSKKGFHRIDVTTDFDIHLHHPAGYDIR